MSLSGNCFDQLSRLKTDPAVFLHVAWIVSRTVPVSLSVEQSSVNAAGNNQISAGKHQVIIPQFIDYSEFICFLLKYTCFQIRWSDGIFIYVQGVVCAF